MKNGKKLRKCAILLFYTGTYLFFITPAKAQDASPGTGKLLDMTYTFDEKTIYWPTVEPFELEKVHWGPSQNGWWYAGNNYGASEHVGTHVDAPIHFAEKGKTIDQIPLHDWIGPAVKIDVVSKCLSNRDYLLTVDDIKEWEAINGIIPDNAWVLMYTGIDTRYYPDRKGVLGTEKTGMEALPELSFPGFSPEAAEFLVTKRNIKGIDWIHPVLIMENQKILWCIAFVLRPISWLLKTSPILISCRPGERCFMQFPC